MAGRKPGTPKTGGRKAGTPNKATANVKAAAQVYTVEAIETLAAIMRKSESDQARVAASNAILDRGHGKPSQTISGDPDNPLRTVTSIKLVGPE